MNTCNNCKNKFTGKYCNLCGEKVIESADLSLSHIFSQAFESITNFDSKIFQTIKLLFFFPGKLTAKYVAGIRVPYMKPFQIFLIANVIFFIFLSEIDLFRTPSRWYFKESFDGIKVLEQVREISANRNLEQSEIAVLYDQKSSNLAKGLIFILIPFIALVGKLMHLRQPIEFGKHIIFATHYFSFVLLASVIISEGISLLDIGFNKWFFIIPITSLMFLYYIVGLKVFYKNAWIAAILKGIIGVLLINVFIQFYRVGINIVSLNAV